MVPDARSSSPASNRQFDFNSQAGVLLVLAAIRKSDCTTAVRNELRDLVFLYSNGGGDPAVRNVLEERLKTYNVTLSEVAVQAVVPTYSFRTTVRLFIRSAVAGICTRGSDKKYEYSTHTSCAAKK